MLETTVKQCSTYIRLGEALQVYFLKAGEEEEHLLLAVLKEYVACLVTINVTESRKITHEMTVDKQMNFCIDLD